MFFIAIVFTKHDYDIKVEFIITKTKMAPPSKKSKVVNKDDLRKLMKEHKTIGSVNKKRIESPLAKYIFSQLC